MVDGAAVAASPRALARRRTHELSSSAPSALEGVAAAACSSHADAVDIPTRFDDAARAACGPAQREVTGSSEHQHPWLATCISITFLITVLFMLLNSEALFGL